MKLKVFNWKGSQGMPYVSTLVKQTNKQTLYLGHIISEDIGIYPGHMTRDIVAMISRPGHMPRISTDIPGACSKSLNL